MFVHRWLGIALCLLFLLWFPSGIGMMYWPAFPGVRATDHLEHSPALNASTIRLSPAEAYAALGATDPPRDVRLGSFDGRPVYRFRHDFGQDVVYADTGEVRDQVSRALLSRVAASWTGQPADAARIEPIEEVDQWTIQMSLADIAPVWKYTWPSGDQVYMSETTGEVVQHTTTGSRMAAYVSTIPHWFYFAPLRKHGPEWSRIVIWSSGIGTGLAALGVVLGVWMYSPRKRYRNAGTPTAIPYRGQKRWHTVLGLTFGVAAATWAFSGMLSMDPFPMAGSSVADADAVEGDLERALRGEAAMDAFTAKDPRAALAELAGSDVKELEFASFAGEPVYMAALAGGDTRIVPVAGAVRQEFDRARITEIIAATAPALAGTRVLDQYDRYYLDRRRQLPLPVILAELNDEGESRFYIDPKTARVVGRYNSGNWFARWVYNGLHSLNFPWLYNYRPAWDIVVLTFMLGGTALCITSLVLAWRAVGRALRSGVARPTPEGALGDDLVVEQ